MYHPHCFSRHSIMFSVSLFVDATVIPGCWVSVGILTRVLAINSFWVSVFNFGLKLVHLLVFHFITISFRQLVAIVKKAFIAVVSQAWTHKSSTIKRTSQFCLVIICWFFHHHAILVHGIIESMHILKTGGSA